MRLVSDLLCSVPLSAIAPAFVSDKTCKHILCTHDHGASVLNTNCTAGASTAQFGNRKLVTNEVGSKIRYIPVPQPME